jgi:hypothetical protein
MKTAASIRVKSPGAVRREMIGPKFRHRVEAIVEKFSEMKG